MQLDEHAGKELLSHYGLRVPRGGLWPDLPVPLTPPLAVKAQVAAGGRGRRGGVRRVDALADVEASVRALRGMAFDGSPVDAVRVEEWVPTERELYLAVLMDRVSGGPVLLASPEGGINVEEAVHLRRIDVDPWIGIRDYQVRAVASALQVEDDVLRSCLSSVWQVFTREDALLVEVNPLAWAGGGLMALDARIVLDDNALFRHQPRSSAASTTSFEARCASLGASGVELSGDVALVTSGAGLAMASLDILVAMGGRARAVVDLGAVVFQQPEKIGAVFDLIGGLRPKVVLVNLFMQLVPCDLVAAGIAHGSHATPPLVVRMRGLQSERGKEILESHGARVYADMDVAFREAIVLVERSVSH